LFPATFAANRRPLPPLPFRWAATATTATPVVELTIIYCQRRRQQQHHHQRTNSSTNVKMFTSPDNLDLFK
jgi:hypothetical protein